MRMGLIDGLRKIPLIMRHTGRPISHRKLIAQRCGEALEYDHAVILDADSLDAKNLYVAMTRGAKTLTIVGGSGTRRQGNEMTKKLLLVDLENKHKVDLTAG